MTVTSSTTAWAHGAGETTEGYVLVQQALGHLAHDSSHGGIESALEKVDDALATKDKSGVNVAEVEQAKAALSAGRTGQARLLLQHSILAATGSLAPAIGEETGTTVVRLPLAGRGSLSPGDWVLVSGSALAILAGLAIAWWFRPQDNLRQLRRRLDADVPSHSDASGTADRL